MRRSLAERAALRTLVVVAWLIASAQCWAQGAGEGAEYQVKAAFLYKFAGYVEWPQGGAGSPQAPFTIGIVGAQALVDELVQVVSGRIIDGRNVVVRRLKQGESLAGVQMLFIEETDALPANRLQQWVQQRPVLIVTESEGALERGSMINFVLVERRVRFEIALDTAERNGLHLSSRLLAVAQRVLSAGQ